MNTALRQRPVTFETVGHRSQYSGKGRRGAESQTIVGNLYESFTAIVDRGAKLWLVLRLEVL